jgi:hypothetical protein
MSFPWTAESAIGAKRAILWRSSGDRFLVVSTSPLIAYQRLL